METKELIEALERCMIGGIGVCGDCLFSTKEHCAKLLTQKVTDTLTNLERENAMLEHTARVPNNTEKAKQLIDEFASSISLLFYQEFDELIPSIMEDKILQAAEFYKEKL